MNWTFGIITKGDNLQHVNVLIDSICDEMPHDNYQIIVVGDCNINHPKVMVLPFDEPQKPGWITRKKNIITTHAQFDNIVYTHDYFQLRPNWYSGFEKFGDEWDVAMNVLINKDGTRFRDWCIWDDPDYGPAWTQFELFCPDCGTYRPGSPRLAPYDYTKTQHMYISGSYWVAKKQFMTEYPLDERWVWGQAEDVEWSDRIRTVANYRMNTYSAALLQKHKDTILQPLDVHHTHPEYFMGELV